MIGKVQPKVDYNEIRKSAYLTVTLLRDYCTDCKLADIAYKRFIAEGKKAPGYAATIMQTTKNNAFLSDTKNLLDNKIKSDAFERRSNNLKDGMLKLNSKNSSEYSEFEQAGKEMYPKTWNIRKSILNFYHDNYDKRYPTSHCKDEKRLYI